MEVAAAVITFGTVILKTSKELRKAARKIKYARREITKLSNEMGIFADLYEDFYRVCISEQRKKGRKTFTAERLIRWIRDAIKAFDNLLDRVEALAGDSKYSRLETLAAHVKWFFSENEVKYLRCSLTVARENMRGFTNLSILESITEEIQLIKDVLAQGSRHEIQMLEDQLGVTLEEKLEELKETSHNRRRQKHAIQARLEDAADELELQGKKVSASPRVPKSEQLFKSADDIEDYALEVQRQRRSDTASIVLPGRRSTRADSVQAADSTASPSFVSKPSLSSEPVEPTSSATSAEELDKTPNQCGICTGICACSDLPPYSVAPSHPPSPDLDPPPRSATFGHPSHRFDRSWQQPAGNDLLAQLIKEAFSPSGDQPSTGRGVLPTDGSGPIHGDYESDNAGDLGESSDSAAQASPFRPVAGVQGKFPRNWRTRHVRCESTGEHWYREL